MGILRFSNGKVYGKVGLGFMVNGKDCRVEIEAKERVDCELK